MPEPMLSSPLEPWAFLRLRREASNLSLDDIALMTETVPAVSARSRAEWLATMEAGAAPIPIGMALRLHQLLRFDWNIFLQLCAIAEGIPANLPVVCRICACSEWDPCEVRPGITCGWAKPDLCTSCVTQVSREPLLEVAA